MWHELTTQMDTLDQQCQSLLNAIATVTHFQSPGANRRGVERRREDRGEIDRRRAARRDGAATRLLTPSAEQPDPQHRYERRVQERRRGMDRRRYGERRLLGPERLNVLRRELASAVQRYEQLTEQRARLAAGGA
jgi:hypothetical protein